jgi:signal transduction histidine kinase
VKEPPNQPIDENTRGSGRTRVRLGVGVQIGLVLFAGFVVATLGQWSFEAMLDARAHQRGVDVSDPELADALPLAIEVRDHPEHAEVVKTWLMSEYRQATFSVFDDAGTLITSSEPPCSEDVSVADVDWDAPRTLPSGAWVHPMSDRDGARFYAVVTDDVPPALDWGFEHEAYLFPVLIAVVFIIISIVLGYRIVRPVEQMTRAARAIAAGSLHRRSGVVRGDEIGELARAFDTMASRNTQLLLAQQTLLAQVGHELRTPLARIGVALDIARERVAHADAPQLHDVDRDLDEMARLISDILAVSRLETAQMQGVLGATLQLEEVQLDALVEEVVRRFSTAFPDRRISPCMIEPGEILGDRILLGRVLWNLLENAHRYSPLDQSIGLRTVVETQRVVWLVEDRGEGIDPDLSARVFEPFFQWRTAGDATTGGFGLGLSLCRRVIDAHGGTIALENRTGGGLCARVTLPLAPPAED